MNWKFLVFCVYLFYMNISNYKDLLLKEQDRLIEAMGAMGVLTGVVDGDWTVHKEEGPKETEPNMLASEFEEETTNEGVLETLEERLKEVTDALERVERGIFGKCIICSKDIERERLDANPAATDCLKCSHLA